MIYFNFLIIYFQILAFSITFIYNIPIETLMKTHAFTARKDAAMLHILPSAASADPLDLRSVLRTFQGTGRLHLDIEDGNFINNITFGLKTVSAIAREFPGTLDVHLMVREAETWLEPLARLRVRAVCAHIEALAYPARFLRRAQRLGMHAGLAFNLKVRPEEVLSYTGFLDYVLVMTSEPDGETQDFFPCAFSRISAFRALLPDRIPVWCDGGVRPEHLSRLKQCGVENAVMGRALFSADDPAALLAALERSVN